jgi:hypothetical protein
MKKITLRHEINCSVDHFWKVFFDKEFNQKLFVEELGFPGPLKKLLGDSFGYEEDGTFDRKSGVWKWKMKPNTLADKLRTEGKVICEPIGADKCRRIADIEMEAKVFGLGGLLEGTSEKEMTQGWNNSATFMNRWLKDHPPT